jgi:hypothetical protein
MAVAETLTVELTGPAAEISDPFIDHSVAANPGATGLWLTNVKPGDAEFIKKRAMTGGRDVGGTAAATVPMDTRVPGRMTAAAANTHFRGPTITLNRAASDENLTVPNTSAPF